MASESEIATLDEGMEVLRKSVETESAHGSPIVYLERRDAEQILSFYGKMREALIEHVDHLRARPRVIQVATTIGGSIARLYSDGRVTLAYQHPDGRWHHGVVPEMPEEERDG